MAPVLDSWAALLVTTGQDCGGWLGLNVRAGSGVSTGETRHHWAAELPAGLVVILSPLSCKDISSVGNDQSSEGRARIGLTLTIWSWSHRMLSVVSAESAESAESVGTGETTQY